jgi:hypothetical protein
MSGTLQIKEFEREMLSRTRKWSDCAEELGARPGLRAVPFSGELLRAAALSGGVKEWLTQLFEQLPADVAVMDMDWLGGSVIFMKPVTGAYTDTYCFIVGSREWPPIEEGSEIPLFVATFKREWACTNGCGYAQNSIDRPTCEVCGRGRGA